MNNDGNSNPQFLELDSVDNNDANSGSDSTGGTQDAGSRIALLVGQQNVIPQSIKNRHMGEPNSYMLSGTLANRPTSGITVTGTVTGNSVYFATDVNKLYIWTGTAWDAFQTLNNSTVFSGQYDNGTQKGTYNINWANGDRQKITCDHTGNLTLTYSGALAGQVLTLDINEDSTGGSSITLPTTKWPNGVAGIFVTTASALNTLVTEYDGTQYKSQLAPGWA